MFKLGDPAALEKLMECKKEGGDTKSEIEERTKELREMDKGLAGKAKGLKLDIVKIDERPPSLDENGKNRHAYEKGAKLGPDCTAKVSMVEHKVEVTLKVGGADTTMRMEMLESDGGWYLVDDIDLDVPSSAAAGGGSASAGGAGASASGGGGGAAPTGGYAKMIAQLSSFKDRMCACKDQACATAVTNDMAAWSTDQAKASADMSDYTAESGKQMQAVMDGYSKCMTVAYGGTATTTTTATTTPPASGSAAAAPALAVGDRVMAQWTNGDWYPARSARSPTTASTTSPTTMATCRMRFPRPKFARRPLRPRRAAGTRQARRAPVAIRRHVCRRIGRAAETTATTFKTIVTTAARAVISARTAWASATTASATAPNTTSQRTAVPVPTDARRLSVRLTRSVKDEAT